MKHTVALIPYNTFPITIALIVKCLILFALTWYRQRLAIRYVLTLSSFVFFIIGLVRTCCYIQIFCLSKG